MGKCKLYRYVPSPPPPPPFGVGCLRLFGLKTGTDYAHFGLESGMVFEGTTGVYERIYRFNSNVKERGRNMRILNGFEEFFCLHSNLSNNDIISVYRPGLKTGVDFRGLV